MAKLGLGDLKSVYSTDKGRMCPNCGKPVDGCVCKKQKKAPAKGDGIVRVSRETKGRKGKGVTIVRGLPLAEDELKALAKELKKRCGTGGTVKDAAIVEIQGDVREMVVSFLKDKGYTVKLAGG